MLNVLLFGAIFTTLSTASILYLPNAYLFSLVFNFIGAFSLTEYFGKRHFGGNTKYKSRNALPAFLLFLVIQTIIFIIVGYLNGDLQL